jgi:hypothetical protein
MNWILTELSGVELPDERFRSNLISIAEGSVLGTLSFSRAVGAFTEIGMAVIFKRRLEFVIDPQQNSLEALGIRLYSR